MPSTRPSQLLGFALALLTFFLLRGIEASAHAGPTDRQTSKEKTATGSPDEDMLEMSRAVVCRSIDGYEQFEPLGDTALTSEEKLLVYYRPLGYVVGVRPQGRYVHFTQDGRIRRRGQKTALRMKKNLLDITSEGRNPPPLIYLRNTVSLKDLPPGEYEFDIILRDENAPGHTATQTVSFKVAHAETVKPESEPSEKGGR